MSSARNFVVILASCIGLGSILVAAPASAEPKAWDEAEVAKLANQLVSAVANIKNNVAGRREEADPSSARWVVLDDLMQLQHRAVAFEGLVRSGQGRDKTEPVFRRIRSAVDNARRDAPAFPDVQKQREHIDRAQSALTALTAYYEDE
jgi:phage shock protein A